MGKYFFILSFEDTVDPHYSQISILCKLAYPPKFICDPQIQYLQHFQAFADV